MYICTFRERGGGVDGGCEEFLGIV